MPRTLLPRASIGGENTANPSWPGDTASTPPDTPLLAGRPTRYIHSPEKSYMPHVVITLSTRTADSDVSARTPVTGFTPPFARVAAITARSLASTSSEHCRK